MIITVELSRREIFFLDIIILEDWPELVIYMCIIIMQHHITHYSGYINHYNRRYVYRPWHDYYRRPNVNVSIVFGRPYRAYYEPQRISYNKYVTVYNNYYVTNKRKRNFYRPSQKIKSYNHGRRTSAKRQYCSGKNQK